MKKAILLVFLSSFLFSDYLSSPYARKDQKEVHYYTIFEVLVTKAQMNGLDYIINNSSSSDMDAHVDQLDFPYRCGGKLILGYIFGKDHWEAALGGNFLFSTASDRAHRDVVNDGSFNNLGLIPIWSSPQAYGQSTHIRFSDAKAQWHLHFYNLEFELARSCKIGEKVILRPSFGLKNFYSYQRFNVKYLNGQTIPFDSSSLTPLRGFVRLTNDAVGIGPKVGVETKWFVYKRIKIIFDATGALLQTYFNSKRDEKDSFLFGTVHEDNFKITNHFNSLKPYAGINFGIGWERTFTKPDTTPVAFYLNMTYSLENYWKLNQLLKFADVDNEGAVFSDNSDFQMQSIILSFGAYF